ncbi:MAG: hypothetical protein QXZ09_10110 [Candidatus Methanomethylicaceae archaeon]
MRCNLMTWGVNGIIHKQSIVNEALGNDSMIVLGNLMGISVNGKSRGFNKKFNKNGIPTP